MIRLENKLCVVTGASRGIGAAIAERFSAEGGLVIVTDQDLASAQNFAEKIGAEVWELEASREDHWNAIEKR